VAIPRAGHELSSSEVDGVPSPLATTEADRDVVPAVGRDSKAGLVGGNPVPRRRRVFQGEQDLEMLEPLTGRRKVEPDGDFAAGPVHHRARLGLEHVGAGVGPIREEQRQRGHREAQFRAHG
jgi:hypothetical protein